MTTEEKVEKLIEAEKPLTTEESAQLRSQLQTMEDNWKNEQRVSSKHLREKEEAERRLGDFDSIKEQVNLQNLMISELVNKVGDDGEPKEREDRFAEAIRKSELATLNRKADEAERIAREAGLDIKNDPKLKAMRYAFAAGFADEGLRELREIASQAKPEPKEDIDEIVNKKVRERLIEAGLLTPEGASPSAPGAKSFQETEKAYIKGDITSAQYEEEARKHGKL